MQKKSILAVIGFILLLTLVGCRLNLPFIKTRTPTVVPPTHATLPLPNPSATQPPPATPTTPPSTATSLPATPTPDPILDPAGITLETITRNEEGQNPNYQVTLQYPALTAPADERLMHFNQLVEAMINELANSFKADLANVIADPNFGPVLSTQQITYSVTFFNQGVISINFNVGFYMAGAAHPNSYSVVLTYDLYEDKQVQLADLFIPGADYLQALSDYCVTTLTNEGRLEFPGGAQPSVENYKNWNLTHDGVRITFDPYQVGPYAMGPQVVDIPFSVLTPIFQNTGALARVLNSIQNP